MFLHHFQKCFFRHLKVLIMSFRSTEVTDGNMLRVFFHLLYCVMGQNLHLHACTIPVDYHWFSRKFSSDLSRQCISGGKIAITQFHTGMDLLRRLFKIFILTSGQKMQIRDSFVIKDQIVNVIIHV